MNIRIKDIIKNFSYTASSNLIVLAVSSLIILIIPRYIGINEYGYWQIYVFYSSYVGFLHFGWSDGIYLRYGGANYNDLNKKLFFSQFYMFLLMQVVLAFILFFISNNYFAYEMNRSFIIEMTLLSMVLVNTRGMLLFILQGSNELKQYAQITILGRVIFLIFSVSSLIIGARDFKMLVIGDLIGRFISLIYAMYICRAIVLNNVRNIYIDLGETFKNIRAGVKLMLSNISSMLIVGSVRFGVEQAWDIATFAKVSLTLSISSLLMLFINSIGIVMFPVLRRANTDNLPHLYNILRNFLMVTLLGMLNLYYPFQAILLRWLPQYEEGLYYMALVFPMVVFEGKIAVLMNTYLKTLRKEKLLLWVNLVSLGLSVVVTYVTTVVLNNLTISIVSIVFLLFIKSAIAEIALSRILTISIYKNIILELIMTLVFICSGWFVGGWISFLIYNSAFIIYIIVKKQEVIKMYTYLKSCLQ